MVPVRNDQTIYRERPERWWDGSFRGYRMLENKVRARLAYFDRVDPEWSGKETLDLGCGGGFMSEALARRGARVTGLDPAGAALEAARKHARESGLEINYREGTGQALPLPDGSMDRVVCVDVLEHIPEWQNVIGEIHRVLKPGGIFFFDTVNRNWLAKLLAVTMAESVLGLIPKGTHDPERFIRPAELRAELTRLGFQVSRFKGLGPVGINRRLDFTFGIVPSKALMYLGHGVKPAP